MNENLEFVDELISEVKKRPVLWDQSSYHHKRSIRMIEEWQAIATKFKMTPDEVEIQWRALKNKFHIEAEKIQLLQGGEKTPNILYYTVDWVHFEKLLFLYGSRGNVNKNITSSPPEHVDAEESNMSNEDIKVECDLFEHFDDFEIHYAKTDLDSEEVEEPIEDDQKMQNTSTDQDIDNNDQGNYRTRGNVEEHVTPSSSEHIEADEPEMSIKDIKVECDSFEHSDEFAKTTLRRQKPQTDSFDEEKLKFIDELIGEVKKRPVLWDKNKYRYNRIQMMIEWKVIASKFKMTPQEIKKKNGIT